MNIINKINKYLLENYPLIWNTRLFWMIAINILVHILFFIIGFNAVNNLDDLKDNYSLESFFYDSSALYYNFLISIFILIIWILFYVRNNAFKNLYHLPKAYLCKQFVIILSIFFISISQFYSFKQGLITRIKSDYNWEKVDSDIKLFNKTALFLIQNEEDYEIDKKKYPKPFPLKVAITENNLNVRNIDTTKAYIQKNDILYQFFTIDEDLWQRDLKENNEIIEYARNNLEYRIVTDVSAYEELLNPSLLNYSKELFTSGQDSLTYKLQLKNHQKILENGDEYQIKRALKTFLNIADTYEIEHNLEVETWFQLINKQPNYNFTELINSSNPINEETLQVAYDEFTTSNTFDKSLPYSKNLYVNLGNTNYVFSIIHEAYYPVLEILILYFFIGFSFFLAFLLFIFKTTSGKSLLFSVVASLVVLVLIVWLMSSSRHLFLDTNYREYLILLFISSVLLVMSIISYLLKWRKIVASVLWSLALFAMPTFFLASSLFYIQSLKETHKFLFPKDFNYVSSFDFWFGQYGFWCILLISMMTICIYSIFIRKLKARPA